LFITGLDRQFSKLPAGWLVVPFQHKYDYVRDDVPAGSVESSEVNSHGACPTNDIFRISAFCHISFLTKLCLWSVRVSKGKGKEEYLYSAFW